jgi:hypothetical protein
MVCGLFIGLALFASGCAPTANAGVSSSGAPVVDPSQTAAAFTDPFAYCAAVGTVDKPDTRYTGEKAPDAVIQGYLKSAGLTGTTEPMDLLKHTTNWRCMDHKVYACNFGANLPCDSKANTSKTPTQGMVDFCKENQNVDFIPMSVTGHETVYSWRCAKGAPELGDQIGKVDAAGYLEQIWYPLAAGK